MKDIIFVLSLIIIDCSVFSTLSAEERDEQYLYYSDEDTCNYQTKNSVITIGGTISDTNNQPISNIQVLLLGNNNVVTNYTNENGTYEFTNISNNTRYTIIPCSYEFADVIDNSEVNGETIVSIAQNELGNTDGNTPGKYHGHGGGWCSEFVSWVYWQAGDPFGGGATDGGNCTEDWNMSTVYRIVAGFGRNENWQFMTIEEINTNWQIGDDNHLEPKAGDYVLFSNTTGIDRSHSGLVRNISGTTLHSIEGNVSNKVAAMVRANWRTYQIGNTIVKGIGYRRIVSNITFNPRFFYGYLNPNYTRNFTLIHRNTHTTIEDKHPISKSNQFRLYANYPNPFNSTTHICYVLKIVNNVTLSIYDIYGKLVRRWRIENQATGFHSFIWNGTDFNGPGRK